MGDTNGVAQRVARAPLRVGLAGLGSMGQNHLRLLAANPDVKLVAVADPVEASLDGRGGARRRPGLSLSPGDARRGRRSTPSSSRRPTTAHAPIALAAIDRGVPVLVEKPLAATVEEGLEILAAARRRGRAGPGRARRALQPGGARARPAAAPGLALVDLLDLVAPRRPVPRPDPRRRRDRGPRDPRRRHPVVGHARAADPRVRGDGADASTPTTRTCCSGCSTSPRARPGSSTSTGSRRRSDASSTSSARRACSTSTT